MNIFWYITYLSIILLLNSTAFQCYFITRFRQTDTLFYHLHPSGRGVHYSQLLFWKRGNFCNSEVSNTIQLVKYDFFPFNFRCGNSESIIS